MDTSSKIPLTFEATARHALARYLESLAVVVKELAPKGSFSVDKATGAWSFDVGSRKLWATPFWDDADGIVVDRHGVGNGEDEEIHRCAIDCQNFADDANAYLKIVLPIVESMKAEILQEETGSPLKVCAFCPSHDVGFRAPRAGKGWFVCCNACGASTGENQTREAAAKAWNRRSK